uniref:Putative molecular chaperone n=1 Tax=Ixodes ricinus TaxID=34613 RepID=A0A0K8R6E7_IXORI
MFVAFLLPLLVHRRPAALFACSLRRNPSITSVRPQPGPFGKRYLPWVGCWESTPFVFYFRKCTLPSVRRFTVYVVLPFILVGSLVGFL